MTASGFELIARAVVREGTQVLLAHPAGRSWYFLPGGHVELGESAVAALRRELHEELGVPDVEVGDLVAVTENRYGDDRGDHHELNLVFEVAARGIEDRSREVHIGFSWVEQDELAGLRIRPEAVARILRDGLDGRRLPLLGEGFDEDEAAQIPGQDLP